MQSKKNKIYTKTGDEGTTSLVTGRRISKMDKRLEAYGTIDELSASIGLAAAWLERPTPKDSQWSEENRRQILDDLRLIQNILFNLGSQLACDQKALLAKLPKVEDQHVEQLEKRMDQWDQDLPPLNQFVLPGGTILASYIHLSRTICRRGERAIIDLHQTEPQSLIILRYINRLSDYLFVLSRYVNYKCQYPEILWNKDI